MTLFTKPNQFVGIDASALDAVTQFDLIKGTAGDDTLQGTNGDDIIKGGAGRDLLTGFGGDDVLHGGTGDDTLVGGQGSNTLDGGAGNDLAIIDESSATAVQVNLSHWHAGATTTIANGSGGTDTLIGIDRVEIDVSATEATVTGSAQADIIRIGGDGLISGGGGDDTIFSAYGDSTLSGGDGADTFNVTTISGGTTFLGGHVQIDGGAGDDVVIIDWSAEGGGVAKLRDGTLHASTGDGALTVDGVGIERLEIFGGNIVTGGKGADTLSGGYGNDSIRGGGGDDIISGGAGNDTLDGGHGVDLYLWDSRGSFSPVMMDQSAFDISGATLVIDDHQGGQDTVSNFEGVALDGGFGADTLIGSAGPDVLMGWYGADSISGGAGNDLIIETPLASIPFGAVTLTQGDDTIDGGTGEDTVSYAPDDPLAQGGVPADLIVDLRAGTAFSPLTGHDTLISIEHVIAGAGDDTLIGSGRSETLEGGAGNDLIIGGGGDDVMIGGSGADLFVFKSLADIPADGFDRIMDLSNEDRIDLSGIDADPGMAGDQAFTIVSHFDGKAGELLLRYDPAGGYTEVVADLTGDGEGQILLRVAGDHRDFSNFVL